MPESPRHIPDDPIVVRAQREATRLPKTADAIVATRYSAETPPDESTGQSRRADRPAALRAQEFWDTYSDLRGLAAAYLRTLPTKSAVHSLQDLLTSEEPAAETFRASPAAVPLLDRLAAAWSTAGVRTAVTDALDAHAEQWEGVNGNWESYTAARTTRDCLAQEEERLHAQAFAERAMPQAQRSRTLPWQRATVAAERAVAEKTIAEIVAASPELAARVLAEDLRDRHREATTTPDGFMWFDAPRATLRRIEAAAAENGTCRPIVLVGEPGVGKTSLIQATAEVLTGKPAEKVICGDRTKAVRDLLADEGLDGRVAYKPVLRALTGKRFADDAEPADQGHAVFLEELNAAPNDEVRAVVTLGDTARPGGRLGASDGGANPDDRVQPLALVFGAMNPASEHFPDRTVFSPEVDRKMTTIAMEQLPNTPAHPELFEALMVGMMDADGRITADDHALGPSYTEPIPVDPKNPDGAKQAQLISDHGVGGTLWRFAQMLHHAAENKAGRDNAFTGDHPDWRIARKTLPLGDVLGWLRAYRDGPQGMHAQRTVAQVLSERFARWCDESFPGEHDAEDRRLWIEFGKQFKIIPSATEGTTDAPPHFRLLTPREVAMQSPRVPRPIEQPANRTRREAAPTAPEFFALTLDVSRLDGTMTPALALRVDDARTRARYRKKGAAATSPVYILRGIVRECRAAPDLVGQQLCIAEDREDAGLVVPRLDELERIETPLGELARERAEHLTDRLRVRWERFRSVLAADAIPFDPPTIAAPELPHGLTQAHLDVIRAFLHDQDPVTQESRGGFVPWVLPTADDLYGVRGKNLRAAETVLYPKDQHPEDTTDGIIAKQPDWWTQDATGTTGVGERWGTGYLRAMASELNNMGGRLVLLDTAQKPNYTSGRPIHYGSADGTDPTKDPLLPFLHEHFGRGKPPAEQQTITRMNHTWDEWQEFCTWMTTKMTDDLHAKGCAEVPVRVMLVPAALENLFLTTDGKASSQTHTSDWTSTILTKGDGTDAGRRLVAGHSVYGGAADLGGRDRGGGDEIGGARLAVVLG